MRPLPPSRTRTLTLALVGLISAVLLMTACGGDDDGEAASPAQPAETAEPTTPAAESPPPAPAEPSAQAPPEPAEIGTITSVAGGGESVEDGVPALEAQFVAPAFVAFDGEGNLYVSEDRGYRIRRVDPSGVITTVAGTGKRGYSGDGGPATEAEIGRPGIAVGPDGSLYIPDIDSHVIRKVDPNGTITTAVGTGTPGSSGNGGPATAAEITRPEMVITDAAGNLYFSDGFANVVRRVDASGVITTIAGTGAGCDPDSSGDGGPATEAKLGGPAGLALDPAGNLFIGEAQCHRIRKVDASGVITTIAGTGFAGFSGDGESAVEAQLGEPWGLALDQAGNLYIAESQNHRIRKVDTSGTITTIAGTGLAGFSGDGGAAIKAELSTPIGLAVDQTGDLYVGFYQSPTIRKIVLTEPEAAGSTPESPYSAN